MGEREDDFRGWDARARWSYENNEEMKFILQEKEAQRCYKIIIEALKESPKSAKELARLCNISTPKTVDHIFRLRQKRYGIRCQKMKTIGIYMLESEPKRAAF